MASGPQKPPSEHPYHVALPDLWSRRHYLARGGPDLENLMTLWTRNVFEAGELLKQSRTGWGWGDTCGWQSIPSPGSTVSLGFGPPLPSLGRKTARTTPRWAPNLFACEPSNQAKSELEERGHGAVFYNWGEHLPPPLTQEGTAANDEVTYFPKLIGSSRRTCKVG